MLSQAHQHCMASLMLEKGPCVASTCHLLPGLSQGEGIRWRLSTEHLLISIEHLISSCCFVKSSDKKRNPFLFIFSWETLSPFLQLMKCAFWCVIWSKLFFKVNLVPGERWLDQQPPVRGTLHFSVLCTHCTSWKGGQDSYTNMNEVTNAGITETGNGVPR